MKELIILFLYFICILKKCDAQTNTDKTSFEIKGQVGYRDTGSIFIWYRDAGNKYHRDTIALNQGGFNLSGTVRGATEALIWTNPKNIDFDHPGVIRFILEPGIVIVSKPDEFQKATITGSPAQMEKEQWDNVKLPLTAVSDRNREMADSLRKIDRSKGQLLYKNSIDSLYRVNDSIRMISYKLDVDYIAKHPDSYLGMYLLSWRCRKIPLDSLLKLYSAFPESIRSSSLAYDVLLYAYPLTDNKKFREKNPLYGTAFNKRLARISSIHDFNLEDISGTPVSFKTFRGKYLVVDVWASWCKPCIANIPAWNDLMKEYDPKLIQFISVSLDDAAADWRKAVEKHKPGGVQVLDSNAFAGLFAVYCRIAYLPRYLIVDPAGQIINYSAPHPRQPELRNLLNELVKKKTDRD
jgi:thiol-disulfide isomerase/thioredoxin